MQFSTAITLAALSAGALAGNYTNSSVVTVDVTYTGYTTYCPESTVLVVTTCTKEVCAPKTVTVSEATTVTFTEECVFPTTYTTAYHTTTSTLPCEECEKTTAPVVVGSTSTTAKPPTVSTVTNAGNKQVAGAVAGLAAVAAALL